MDANMSVTIVSNTAGLKSRPLKGGGGKLVKKPTQVGQVTQRQLAELAGVSISTIYNCLHARHLVNKKTLDHVELLMERYDYHPNSIAKAMVNGRTQVIGVIVPRFDVGYFAKMVSDVEQLLGVNGYSSLICQHLDDVVKEDREVRLMREKRVDGVIVRSCGARTDPSLYQRLSDANVPFVLMGRGLPGLDDYLVTMDNFKATADLTEYLIQKGHKRIGYLGWDMNSSRYKGYRDTLKKHGIHAEENMYIQCETEYSSGQKEAYEMMRRPKEETPTALIAFNSCTAVAAIEALWNMGLKVPEDVAVATVGGDEDLRLSHVRLTAVIMPVDHMVREAVMMLYDQLDNKYWKRGPIIYPGEFYAGNTA